MKYYSRTPKEFREHFEKTEQDGVKKRRRGHIILFLDLIVVILILFYFYHSKMNIEKKELPQAGEKVFEWQGWQITAGCMEKSSCILNLKKEKINEQISHVYWTIREFKQEADIFRKKDIIKDEKEQSVHLSLPFEIKENHDVFLLFYNKDNEEVLKFRAYP